MRLRRVLLNLMSNADEFTEKAPSRSPPARNTEGVRKIAARFEVDPATMGATMSKSVWKMERFRGVVVPTQFHHASASEKVKLATGPMRGFSGFWRGAPSGKLQEKRDRGMSHARAESRR